MKKALSVILSLLFVFTLVPIASADETAASDYPYIFVHGMMGWGENDVCNDTSYWGFGSTDVDVIDYMRSLGLEAYAPSVGKMSSAWDRACELYAQLTGTVVDYGAAHSAKYGHARYGRDYSDCPIMGYKWDTKSCINLITHSFGGPTANVFTSILEYGVAEEVEADPEGCSEFFRGGHEGVVYACFECEPPNNGSQLSDFICDIPGIAMVVALYANILGTQSDPSMDFMFDQWGLNGDITKGETVTFNPLAVIKLGLSKDHAGYDMTIKGAAELNERFPIAKHTYYFSYTACLTEENEIGLQLVPDSSNVLAIAADLTSLLASKYSLRSGWIGSEWAANDGMVPVVSALYPFNATHEDYSSADKCVPGVWYSMPITYNASHGLHVGGTPDVLFPRFDEMVNIIKDLA